MNPEARHDAADSHERARQLIVADRVEGLSAADQAWLERHLEECVPCAGEAASVAAAIHSLRAVPVLASEETVYRTRLAVRRRAEEMRVERARALPLWAAVTVSAACILLTTPYVWGAFAWLGRAARVPDPVWQGGFVMWWFLPGTVLAAIVAWRQAGRLESTNWGRS